MRRAALAIVVAFGVLAGCGGGTESEESKAERAIKKNILRLAAGWQYEDPGPFYAYYSEDYDFDEVGKEDHLQSIFDDFPYIRNWRLRTYEVDVVDATLALARMHFYMTFYADISALDQPDSFYAWVQSRNVLSQVWKRDFDGVWRVAAEYLSAGWVLGDSPEIGDFSVWSGDEFRAGWTYRISASADMPDSSYRVTLWPDCFAGEAFDPGSAYGWRGVSYFGDFMVRDDALGEYALSFIGQADRPPRTTMLGRRIDAVYIVVYGRSGEKRARQYRAPTGVRKSPFRLLRIHGSAGQSPRPEPRPE
jgi:hypothetical protein